MTAILGSCLSLAVTQCTGYVCRQVKSQVPVLKILRCSQWIAWLRRISSFKGVTLKGPTLAEASHLAKKQELMRQEQELMR